MILPDSSILTNIQFPGIAKSGNLLFEKKYITIRCIENRLYSDEEVAHLPGISRDHTHYKEWKIRKKSSGKLLSYLSNKKKRLKILEVGCGNGWLSHALAGMPGANVVGLDINFTELQQAARVFNEDPHLKFIYGDIYSALPPDSVFDIIVFSASIQYFRSIRKTLDLCLKLLSPRGEIHIIDSPFYQPAEIAAAKERTLEYYSSLGYPEMKDYYFHHDIHELQAFNHTVLFNPFSLMNRLSNNNNPFPWVQIKE